MLHKLLATGGAAFSVGALLRGLTGARQIISPVPESSYGVSAVGAPVTVSMSLNADKKRPSNWINLPATARPKRADNLRAMVVNPGHPEYAAIRGGGRPKVPGTVVETPAPVAPAGSGAGTPAAPAIPPDIQAAMNNPVQIGGVTIGPSRERLMQLMQAGRAGQQAAAQGPQAVMQGAKKYMPPGGLSVPQIGGRGPAAPAPGASLASPGNAPIPNSPIGAPPIGAPRIKGQGQSPAFQTPLPKPTTGGSMFRQPGQSPNAMKAPKLGGLMEQISRLPIHPGAAMATAGTLAGLGATVGGGLGGVGGSLMGLERGNMAEGLGRGIIRGGATGVGAGAGGVLGAILGGPRHRGVGGALGAVGGGVLANYLAGKGLGSPVGDGLGHYFAGYDDGQNPGGVESYQDDDFSDPESAAEFRAASRNGTLWSEAEPEKKAAGDQPIDYAQRLRALAARRGAAPPTGLPPEPKQAEWSPSGPLRAVADGIYDYGIKPLGLDAITDKGITGGFTDAWSKPWAAPATVLTGAAGIYGGYNAIDWLLKQRRSQELGRDMSDSEHQYMQALTKLRGLQQKTSAAGDSAWQSAINLFGGKIPGLWLGAATAAGIPAFMLANKLVRDNSSAKALQDALYTREQQLAQRRPSPIQFRPIDEEAAAAA